MTNRYRYGIIGTGIPWQTEGATGFGMANPHYSGFIGSGRVELVAIADVREDHAKLFLERHGATAPIYSDYHEMLATEKPDIVSICTWPHLHAEMVVAACEAGIKAIHCEKPMATTWGDAKRIKRAADESGSILTFNHQRRFLEPFQLAKRTIDSGEIGKITRLEATCGDMTDWGTHWLDMLFFFNNETPAAWVIGQIDSREEKRVFGAWVEGQGICHFQFTNGVKAMLVTGYEANIGAAIRVFGEDGILEVTWQDPPLRIRAKGDADWRILPTTETIHGNVAIDRACADLIKALDEPGYLPLLTVNHAIQHTEVIFATFESSRSRGRIDLPLLSNDSALIAMVADGSIGPNAPKSSAQ